MTPAEFQSPDIAEAAQDLRDRQEPFAFATIIRSVGATAAKPGAKALLAADGTILQGWLGGGCTRGAVKRAAIEALKTNAPQLISIAPEELLAEKGVSAGDAVDGVTFSRNGCPSKGSVDIFIEPCLPAPELVIMGGSPVAEALARLAPQFHWSVSHVDGQAELTPVQGSQKRVVVVATQGQGDMAALTTSLQSKVAHIAFVGSRKKFASLSAKLKQDGAQDDSIATIKAPAGLDIGAVTPEEIALSILAELVRIRRVTDAGESNV